MPGRMYGSFFAGRGAEPKAADEYAGFILKKLTETCKGQLLSGKDALPSTDGSVIRKMTTTCRTTERIELDEITIIRRPDGFLMMLAYGTLGSMAEVMNDSNDQERAALVRAAMGIKP